MIREWELSDRGWLEGVCHHVFNLRRSLRPPLARAPPGLLPDAGFNHPAALTGLDGAVIYGPAWYQIIEDLAGPAAGLSLFGAIRSMLIRSSVSPQASGHPCASLRMPGHRSEYSPFPDGMNIINWQLVLLGWCTILNSAGEYMDSSSFV